MFQIKHEALIVRPQEKSKIVAQVPCTPHDRGERFVEFFISAGQSPVQSPSSSSNEVASIKPCSAQSAIASLV